MEKIVKKLKWWHIAILLLFFLGMMILMRYFAAQVSKISENVGILDLNFYNSVDFIRRTIIDLGANGRNSYIKFFIVDGFYSLTYCSFYFAATLYLLYNLGIQKKALYLLSVFPIIGMLFDWTENIFLGIAVANWDKNLYSLYKVATIATPCKFIFVYSALLIVLMLFAVLIIKAIKNYKQKKIDR